MTPLFRASMLAAICAMGPGALWAQDSTADAAADLPTGESVAEAGDGPGQPYLKDTFTDWQLICIRVEEGAEPCNMQQTIFDGEGNAVVRISIAPLPPAAAPRAAAVEVATPLETLLREDVVMSIDEGQPKRYKYTFCQPDGCFARFALTSDEVDQMKRGARAQVAIVPLIAPDQVAELAVSLSGFTAAFDAAAPAGQ